MKKSLSALCFLLFAMLFTFSSCEEESFSIMTDEETFVMDSDEAFLAGIRSKMPFLFINIDQDQDRLSGWLINNKSELRSFDIKGAYQFDIRNDEFSSYYIDIIHDASEVINKVDLPELVEHIRTSQEIHFDRSARQVVEGEAVTQAVVSLVETKYENKEDSNDGENCGCVGGENTSSLRLMYTNTLLESTGAVNYSAATEQHRTLVDYVKSFKDQVGN